MCQWPRKQKDAQHTSVLFTGTIKLPFISPKLLSQFLPIYIFSTLFHTLKLKEITLAFLKIIVPEKCLIFFTFFFFTQNYN